MNQLQPDVDHGSRPLGGIRVVELTEGNPGALTGELLALLGADVVKVEDPSGDPGRSGPHGRLPAAFVLANLNKRSVAVDPDTRRGRALVRALSTGADVLVENIGHGGLERFGLTVDGLRAAAPRLVHLAVVGYEPDWELSDLPLSEAVLQCLSGIASITGEPSEAPLRVGPDAAAGAAAVYGAIGVVAALIQRARSGRGQCVEVSVLDAAVNLCRTHFSRSAESGRFHPRPGNRQPAAQAEPTGVFPAAGDGPQDYVFAHASPEHMWRRVLSIIGREDLADDPRFGDGPTRLAHREDVHAVVDEWTRRHPPREILRIWGAAGIPVGATLTTDDLCDDASLHREGQFATVDHAGWGPVRVPVLPFTFDGVGSPSPGEAPGLGAHTAELERTVEGGGRRDRTDPADGSAPAVAPEGPALAGIRVLDFTQALSGPIATQVLAFLGADVVRIQRPAPPSLGIERPWLKLDQLSMNKRSVVLDLKSADGRDAARRLVPHVDVVMENFAPGTMERLGFGWGELRALNPSVVFGRVKGFGPTSPYRDYLAFDNVAEAMGGACALTGHADQEPMLPGPHLGDIGTGLMAALGVLSKLHARIRDGRGGEVFCSMQGTVATVFSRLAFAHQMEDGTAPLRNGFGDLGAHRAPVGAYRCAGGGMNDYCYLAATDDHRWRALAAAMGRADLVHDDRFSGASARWTNRAALDAEIERWTARHTKREICRLLTVVGVEAAPVLDTAELMNDPALRRRGVFTEVPHPVHGRVFHVHWPIRMEHSFVPMTPAPQPGQHTAEVLAGVAG